MHVFECPTELWDGQQGRTIRRQRPYGQDLKLRERGGSQNDEQVDRIDITAYIEAQNSCCGVQLEETIQQINVPTPSQRTYRQWWPGMDATRFGNQRSVEFLRQEYFDRVKRRTAILLNPVEEPNEERPSGFWESSLTPSRIFSDVDT